MSNNNYSQDTVFKLCQIAWSHIAKPHALFIELLLQSLQGQAANIVCLLLLCN